MKGARRAAGRLGLGLAWLALGCQRADATGEPAASGAASASAAGSAAAAPGGVPCGELGCRAFPAAEAAFRQVLAREPRVLAVGEAHAQKGLEGVPSTTRRFTQQLLPVVAPQASHLVLEIWVPDPRCSKEQVKQVAQRQQAVTAPQAATNQNEFVTLGQAARRLGVVPDVLRPACEEYERINAAGAGDLATMLSLIARLTREKLEGELARAGGDGGVAEARPATGPDGGPPSERRLLLAYGGALHNDAEARPGREDWTFGPGLIKASGGRYVELDLIVPEFIKDTETWRALPWYAHYDRERLGQQAVLFQTGERSYTLVFPLTSPGERIAPAPSGAPSIAPAPSGAPAPSPGGAASAR